MKTEFIELNDRGSEETHYQVFIDDDFAGDLFMVSGMTEPDPQGRTHIGPWRFDGSVGTVLVGWPAIRDICLKIEHLNTHWNWKKTNAAAV